MTPGEPDGGGAQGWWAAAVLLASLLSVFTTLVIQAANRRNEAQPVTREEVAQMIAHEVQPVKEQVGAANAKLDQMLTKTNEIHEVQTGQGIQMDYLQKELARHGR